MPEQLCISVIFLNPRYHGRGDGAEPEWPPSPLRLFQALVAANGDQIGTGSDIDAALRWLERQPPPTIITPRVQQGNPHRLSVPNNAMDVVGRAWSRGNDSGVGDANPATHRTMKTVRPMHLLDGDTVHYLWALDDAATPENPPLEDLSQAAARLVALGWGIDLAAGRAGVITQAPEGERWRPGSSPSNRRLRTPVEGTLDALSDRHHSLLHRIGDAGFKPVAPVSTFDLVSYQREGDPNQRPYAVFELRKADGSRFAYPQRKLIHIAGMTRHLAMNQMKEAPPPQTPEDWVEVYVAGHRRHSDQEHRQFSYLPLPSIGHPHSDPAVRRVMVAAPPGDDRLLEHLARRLSGQRLTPTPQTGIESPPFLALAHNDTMASYYAQHASVWASVTPVILPGHSDHKPTKTRRLIQKAIQHAGIEQPCTFEWSAYSAFPKSLSAHKYDRNKRPTGYIRPDHLLNLTAVHLTLQFNDQAEVPGPMVIGAGQHCGLGIMAEPYP